MRLTAWTLFAIAIGFPAWIQWSVQQQVTGTIAQGQSVCGMPPMAAIIVDFLVMVFAGDLASTLAWLDFRDLPRPRAGRRKVELMLVSLPLLAGIGLAVGVALWIVSRPIR